MRPDIVTPGGFFTSYSAPVIASAAAVLLEEADRSPGLANARHNPHVIKSILMAGAAKEPFPGWNRSNEQPLDEIFGAGRLDIYDSHRILIGGEHGPDETAFAPDAGWHLGDVVPDESEAYLFSFETKQETFTVNLAWNRLVNPKAGADFLDAEILLARMELRLFEANGAGLGDEIQVSNDSLNNNQHLYIEGLPAGDYALVVNRIDDSFTESASYALAWNAVAAPPVRFADWQRLFFSDDELNDPEISGPTADPDDDAVWNLLEYALGGNPRQPNRDILPIVETKTEEGIDYLVLTFTRPVGLEDIDYRVDISGNLTNWTEGDAILISSADNGDGTIADTYRDAVPLDAADRRFLRLAVALQEPQ